MVATDVGEVVTPEDWAELMEGEENFGRTRGTGGQWHQLDYGTMASLEEHYEYIVHVPIHGTRSSYVEGCRCQACTRAEREYRRGYRDRAVRPQEAISDDPSPNVTPG
jgi:hypothetical protein